MKRVLRACVAGATIAAFQAAVPPAEGHAALAAAHTRWVFTAGCDMPFLSKDPIRFLAGLRGSAPAVAVAALASLSWLVNE